MLGWFILASHNLEIMGQYRRNQDHFRFHTPFNEHEGSHHTFTHSLNFIIRTRTWVNFYWIISSPRKQSLHSTFRQDPCDFDEKEIQMISVTLGQSSARWRSVTIKLLIKENISCWLQADQKSFMELTRPLYHSCQREWLENFSWISLSEIYHRLCLR